MTKHEVYFYTVSIKRIWKADQKHIVVTDMTRNELSKRFEERGKTVVRITERCKDSMNKTDDNDIQEFIFKNFYSALDYI